MAVHAFGEPSRDWAKGLLADASGLTQTVSRLGAVRARLRVELERREHLFTHQFAREDTLRAVLCALWQAIPVGSALLVSRESETVRLLSTPNGQDVTSKAVDDPRLRDALDRFVELGQARSLTKSESKSLARLFGDQAADPWFRVAPLRVDPYFIGSAGLGAYTGQTTTPSRTWVGVALRLAMPEIARFLQQGLLIEDAFVAGARMESEQIGIEIHDTVLQDLSYIRLQLGRARSRVADDHQAAPTLDALHAAMTEVSSTLRHLSISLADYSAPSDLIAATNGLLELFQSRSPIAAEVHVQGQVRDIGSRVSSQVIRIVREALNNVWKHSNASRVDVEYSYEVDALAVSVTDDGRGFDEQPQARSTLGMRGMQRRVERLGGDFSVRSAVGHGTTIRVDLRA